VKGTQITNTLEFLRRSQFWDDTKIYEYQLTKLRNLVEYASLNVPYYKHLFGKIKLSVNDIKCLDDIHKIPILTKEMVRKNNMDLLSKNVDMRYIKKGKTGGTTGSPVIVYKDLSNRSYTWASYYRWYDWMEVEYGDRAATFWGAPTVLTRSKYINYKEKLKYSIQNAIIINSFEMGPKDLLKVYRKLIKFRPVILKGYLSALMKLAIFIDSNSLAPVTPTVVSTTTETILPHQRKYLEKIFKAPIFDQYGCGELSAISYECSKHNGLHINQEHIICEILDSDNQPIIGTTGRVIGTDLDNYVMPFIRYDNGDMAAKSDIKCSCGVNQPLMNSIEGRTSDTITLDNGSSVHGVFLTDIFYELDIFANHIQRFQAVQRYPGQLQLFLETSITLDLEIIKKLKNKLLLFFSDVVIDQIEEIPCEENGKFRYIKIIQ